ncbi:uncharacterized protein [Petaurus breviceps papuanus]|uniref:uncharacterized protein n=1 Tax=Petaurus breviceps papuanus TaxID=3040969 RepID=UPI0036DF1395
MEGLERNNEERNEQNQENIICTLKVSACSHGHGHCLSLSGSRWDALGRLLVLCWAQHAPGSLEVRDEKTQIVSLNANVTIPCLLSGYGSSPLNLSFIGVRWYLERWNSTNEDKIFEYNGGKWTQVRPGASISMSELRKGDASLHLPHIQLQEGGKYRCDIIIPPSLVQGTARLDVMAQPSSILLPPEITVTEKKAYTLKCTVTEYYPEPVYITWMKVLPGMQSLNVETFEGNSTNSIRNSDGTFNATSSFVLHPVLEDNGTIYQCVVAHKSLLIPLQSSTILIVTAHPSSNLLPQETVVEEKKVYTGECTMAGFRLQSVLIFWENVVQGTHSLDVDNSEYIYKSSIWNNYGTFNATSSFILFPTLEDNASAYLCVDKSLLIPLQNITTWTVSGLTSNTVWMIIVCILLILVICLGVFVWVGFFRKVAPVLCPLPATEYVKHQEPKTFHFVIWQYRPKPLTLKFFLKIHPKSEEELLISWRTQGMEREENSEAMKLMETQARFTLTAEAQDLKHNFFGVSGSLTLISDLAAFTEADLLLQVEHSALKIPLRQKIHLKVIAQPKLKKIRCSSDHPQPGESVTLTCRIHSFFPRAVRVSWYKDNRPMLEGIETSEAETLEDGLLCSCISKLKFSLQMDDIGKKFICEAEVEGGEPVQRHWVLQECYNNNVIEAKCDSEGAHNTNKKKVENIGF